LISLAVHYLIDAKAAKEGVRLNLFSPSTGASKEVLDKEYRPYFFVPHPLTRKDQETIEGLGAKTRVEEKRELLTGQPIRVTKVETEVFFDPREASRRFEKSWESEVPLILGYIYDQDLTFGAQCLIQREGIKTVLQVSEKARQKFEERFSGVREADPMKYDLLERWFTLCSQPVPEIVPERLGIGEKVDAERYYLAFMLSRVANLPVPMAYSSRLVSSWIRSILHNYLRRNNILIPTSMELRRGEAEYTLTRLSPTSRASTQVSSTPTTSPTKP